jgi:predicted ArsR family transcriptional regulator
MRRRLGVRSHEEALRALELLYRQLSISLKAGGDGALEVSHCFFSPFYSSDACRVMSAMDEGIVAGLTGGCELCFEARITDGAPRCVASLRRPASCG